MLLDAAFTALLLLCGVSAMNAPPPTNVTVSCQNEKTTVSWDYSEPQTSFRVYVGGSAGHYEANTTDHQYDLSHFVWKSEEQYMANNHVTVTAIQGGKSESKPVKSKTFSFNHLKTAYIKCLLDFPPVYLTIKETVATVTFQNPFNFYKEIDQAVKQDDAFFKFTVSTDNGTFDASCSVKDLVCRHDFSFPEGVERCVTLEGLLCNKECFNYVKFRKTGHICPSTSSEVHVVVLALMLGILVFVIIVVTTVICKEKGWTMRTDIKTPRFLLPQDWDQQPQYATVPEVYSTVTVFDDERCKSPSVSSEEDSYPTKNPQDSSAGSDSAGSSDGFYMDGGRPEDSSQETETDGQGTDDDSVKTECVSVDLEEAVSAYDRQHAHMQDMGDGDMVTCYSKK